MAADRGAYIDQSQSFNVHMSDPNFGKLTSLHFHAWRKGLKTGMYYLRTRAAADAIKFTVDQQALKAKQVRHTQRSGGRALDTLSQKTLLLTLSVSLAAPVASHPNRSLPFLLFAGQPHAHCHEVCGEEASRGRCPRARP